VFDFEIVTTRQGWIGAEVTAEHIEIAKESYVARQQRRSSCGMQDHFSPDDMPEAVRDTKEDHRWSGDLGEMLLKDYLEQRVFDHCWLANVRESEYDVDFLINGKPIDVKTKRRKKAPKMRKDYFETVNHEQFVVAKKRDIVGYVFCDYAYEEDWIYVTGTVSYQKFDALKIWRAKGSKSNACLISADSWDIPITDLVPPFKWRKAV